MKLNITCAIFLLCLLLPRVASASVVYSYTSPNFTEAYGLVTTNDHFNISFTLNEFLPANTSNINVSELSGFAFFAEAGANATQLTSNINQAEGVSVDFTATTDAQGNIMYWELYWRQFWNGLFNPSENEFYSYSVSGATIASPGANFGKYYEYTYYNRGRPGLEASADQYSGFSGVWQVNEVSAPAVFILFVVACSGLAFRKRFFTSKN
ncbi:hypothetical protein ACOI22_15755 [Glaciecola sp. 2405UD65-10]|uniref:hypothetical protein n=1 Tax=Glaciecola sp. 2405UD65-10 TaxID=3397244 RepID=UPI003B5B2E77